VSKLLRSAKPDDVIVAGVPAEIIREIDYSDGDLE